MKTIFALVVLAVIATVSDSASSRANLNVGSVAVGDRLLYSTTVYKAPINNAIQYEDVVYRGATNTRISAVQAYEVGASQRANAYILRGGIRQNNVTVRFQSERGRGYYYQLSIYGR